jgi:hypothetical protein
VLTILLAPIAYPQKQRSGAAEPPCRRTFALKADAIQASEAGTPQFIFLRSTRQMAPIDTALSECTPYIPADSYAGIFPHPEAAI